MHQPHEPRERFGTQTRRRAVGVVLLALATGSLLLAFLLSRGSEGTSTLGPLDGSHAVEGSPAPGFALANARAPGEMIRLSDFRGRAVVLNWYASWCGPCRDEIPAFQEVAQALAGEVVFLGIDVGESAGRATGILDELGATYPAVLDDDGAVARQYGFLGIPSTCFVDRTGLLEICARGGGMTAQILRDQLAAMGYAN